MTLKYKEYMDKIKLSEEMKLKILSNIEKFDEKSNPNNKSNKVIRPFFKKKMYKSFALAACFALVISSTLLYKNINNPKDTLVSETFINSMESKLHKDNKNDNKLTNQHNNTVNQTTYKNYSNNDKKVVKQIEKNNNDNKKTKDHQTYKNNNDTNFVTFTNEEINSFEKLSEQSGFNLKEITRFPFKIITTSYKYINQSAVIKYSGTKNYIVFKISKNEKNNNSLDLQNNNTVKISLSGREYLIIKENELYNSALWNDEKYSYSISLKKGIDLNSIKNILKNIK